MPILNYTTTIADHKTVGEIQAVLARAGAVSVNMEYDQGQPAAIAFVVRIGDNYVNYRLPSNWEGVYKRMSRDRDVPNRFKNEAQARRVAWRIVKDWVEAQVAIIDAGLAVLPEVFLPYAVAPTGRTMWQEFEVHQKLIGPPKE